VIRFLTSPYRRWRRKHLLQKLAAEYAKLPSRQMRRQANRALGLQVPKKTRRK
jgi:hypothetical protein